MPSARLEWRLGVLIAILFGLLVAPLPVALFPSLPIRLNDMPYSSLVFDPNGSAASLDFFTLTLFLMLLYELATGRITDLLAQAWKAIDWRLHLEDATGAVSERLDELTTELRELQQNAALLKHAALAARSRRIVEGFNLAAASSRGQTMRIFAEGDVVRIDGTG